MPNPIAACGTRSAYNRHLRYKEVTCELCKAASRAHVADWTAKNYERMREINMRASHKYRAKEETKRKRAEYASKRNRTPEGKEVLLRATHRRRARKMGAGFEVYTTQQVLDLYGSLCHLCGLPIDLLAPRRANATGLHIDHVIPIAKGGSDTLANVRPAHGLCNVRKGGR